MGARADYRVRLRDDVMPDVCVEDARSAVRYIRKNAARLGVDPNRLIASGGSSGGHLAACQFIEDSVNDSRDDLSVSTIPQAMVLYNPALDFTFEDLMKRISDGRSLARKISPTVQMDKDTPPAILSYGTADSLALPQGVAYADKAKLEPICSLQKVKGTDFSTVLPGWNERQSPPTDSWNRSVFSKGNPRFGSHPPAPSKISRRNGAVFSTTNRVIL